MCTRHSILTHPQEEVAFTLVTAPATDSEAFDVIPVLPGSAEGSVEQERYEGAAEDASSEHHRLGTGSGLGAGTMPEDAGTRVAEDAVQKELVVHKVSWSGKRATVPTVHRDVTAGGDGALEGGHEGVGEGAAGVAGEVKAGSVPSSGHDEGTVEAEAGALTEWSPEELSAREAVGPGRQWGQGGSGAGDMGGAGITVHRPDHRAIGHGSMGGVWLTTGP